jgi:hypothetical protein
LSACRACRKFIGLAESVEKGAPNGDKIDSTNQAARPPAGGRV